MVRSTAPAARGRGSGAHPARAVCGGVSYPQRRAVPSEDGGWQVHVGNGAVFAGAVGLQYG